MSPSLLRILQVAERQTQYDAAFARRWYRKTGMSRTQAAYYGNRRCWADAVQLVQLNGAQPYVNHLPWR